MYASSAAWLSFALVLTALGGLLTYVMWRRRGTAALLTGAGWTLLPMALYLTGTLRLVSVIADQVTAFATGFVFSPRVWVGLATAGLGVALIVAGRLVRRRTAVPAAPGKGQVTSGTTRRATPAPVDPEFAEIEELLRRRGIT